MFSVLIVDDEPEVVQSIEQAIDWKQYGFSTVMHVFNATDALAMVKMNPIDLVITDIRMPERDGLWLIRQIRHLHFRTMIVILTAHSDFDLVKQALQMGTLNYLLKPIDIHEFITTVRDVAGNLRHKRIQNTNVFRDTILERWLRGQISATELDERSQIAEINTFYYQYAVALLSSAHLPGAVAAPLMDALHGVGSVYSLVLHEQYYALIIGSNHMQTEDVLHILEEYLAGTDILFAIGPVVEACESLYLSYEQAKAALSRSIAESRTDFIRSRTQSPIVDKALTYIQGKYMTSISLKQFCEAQHVNKAYFGRVFRMETGMHFADAVAKQRIEHSSKLLIETEMTVQQIAIASGFSGVAHMNKIYQKSIGISPKQYRMRARNRLSPG